METYKEKITELVSRLKSRNDFDSILLVETMLKSCGAYIYRVNLLEAFILAKPTEDSNEYRTRIAELDKQRSIEHNALISSAKIVNRLCKVNNLPLIFGCNVDNRVDVAEHAFKIVLTLFNDRRL